jgi:hypothetical protein
MKTDQLSFLHTTDPGGYPSKDPRTHIANPDLLESLASTVPINFSQPITVPSPASLRQQVLERILGKISKLELAGGVYVEQYLRHKYRRNCRSNTLKQAAISLAQFLSFYRKTNKSQIEKLSREDNF